MSTATAPGSDPGPGSGLQELEQDYARIRQQSESLCESLAIEDFCIQTIPEVSPTKWHLAHVSWFFEAMILEPFLKGYQCYNPRYAFLFNSYYYTVGEMHPRPRRGHLSRPTVEEIYQYRAWVDQHMGELLADVGHPERQAILQRTTIGLHHEQQHQELLLTDIKHVLAANPLRPSYDNLPVPQGEAGGAEWIEFEGGLKEIGATGDHFAYDNELPRHSVYIAPYRLASRLITNGEYMEFMEAGGYQQSEHWLSDGWASINREGWQAPLYWFHEDGQWCYMTLGGPRAVDENSPVCHVSYYEADAYARWAGKRLPTEWEWEAAAGDQFILGNLRETGYLHPAPAGDPAVSHSGRLSQMYGDVWEWTQSPYTPYPGFRPLSGALGEYNGKFMCNQMVLRGGSCVTAEDHLRSTYRNFFYPHERWQFMGLRLAEDME